MDLYLKSLTLQHSNAETIKCVCVCVCVCVREREMRRTWLDIGMPMHVVRVQYRYD